MIVLSGQAGLPLPRLISCAGRVEVFFASTKVDNRGRLADRSAVRELGWRPGTAVTFAVGDGLQIVASPGRGRATITAEGHLRLPAEVRHLGRVRPGDRLLVVIPPEHDRLVVYPATAVAAALSRIERVREGEGS